MNPKTYWVYIMANKTGTMYVGMTDDLERRVWEHKHDVNEGFTKRYQLHMLVYYEDTNDVWAAIAREKQLKGWKRSRKLALVWSMNPAWQDLAEGWGTGDASSPDSSA